MGGKESKPEEEIIITQQQQTQQQQQQLSSDGFGPIHVIATCLVIIVMALAIRAIWRLLQNEINNKIRRTQSIATIV